MIPNVETRPGITTVVSGESVNARNAKVRVDPVKRTKLPKGEAMTTALERAIEFAKLKVPDYEDADACTLSTFKGAVSIKGIRLFAKRGWPDLVQVLIGRRWITVIRGPYPSLGVNFSITPRAIRDRARQSTKG